MPISGTANTTPEASSSQLAEIEVEFPRRSYLIDGVDDLKTGLVLN